MRGTPQQIIDKYLMLARDAQLSNDRVAEQNFLQHAEHYTRMLGEAQREMQREQEQRQAQNPNQGQGQGDGGNGHGQGGDRQHNQRQRFDERGERASGNGGQTQHASVREDDIDDGPGLVETPETQQRPRSASMMPELPLAAEGAEAAPEGGKKPARGPRGPRKPRAKKAEAEADAPSAPVGNDEPPADAAE